MSAIARNSVKSPSATAAAITSDRAMLWRKTVRQSAFAGAALRLAMLFVRSLSVNHGDMRMGRTRRQAGPRARPQPFQPPCRTLGRSHERNAAQRCVDFGRSEEHTSELQSLMRISYAVF